MSTVPPIISIDDHVIEPPHTWQRWLPQRYRDAGPKVIRAPWAFSTSGRQAWQPSTSGPMTDFWQYEDQFIPIRCAEASVGLPPEQIASRPIGYEEMRPGCYRIPDRLQDMDACGIERSMCFPTVPRLCGQTFLEGHDRELGEVCVRAFNDFMVDEWAGESNGRLIPCCIVPLWDAHLAAAEVRRNAARGVRALSFSELPARLGLPSIHDAGGYWDPLFQACDETGTVIFLHIGSSSTLPVTSSDMPTSVTLALLAFHSQLSMTDLLFSGLLQRFEHLKIAFSEAQIGWWPYVFERCDKIWSKGNAFADINPLITRPPSSYVPGRVYGCFFEDNFGLQSLKDIGEDQAIFECDYPHQDSTWPNTRTYAEQALEGFDQSTIDKLVRQNAIELLGLPQTLPQPVR